MLQKESKRTKAEIAPLQVLCRLLPAASGSSAVSFQDSSSSHWFIPLKEKCKKENKCCNTEEIPTAEILVRWQLLFSAHNFVLDCPAFQKGKGGNFPPHHDNYKVKISICLGNEHRENIFLESWAGFCLFVWGIFWSQMRVFRIPKALCKSVAK